ncbi:MAG: hypothetical protein ACRCUT_06080 [Spirochaetota bacterium]
MKKKKIAVKPAKSSKAENKKDAHLDVCRNAPHAEMARNENKDEPCDDGTKG